MLSTVPTSSSALKNLSGALLLLLILLLVQSVPGVCRNSWPTRLDTLPPI